MVRRLLGGTHVVEVIMPLLSGPSLSHASGMLHFFQDIFRESQPKPRGWGLDLHFVCTARPEMVAAVAMSAQLRLSPDLDAAAGTELRHECAIPPNRVQGDQVNLHVIIQLRSSPCFSLLLVRLLFLCSSHGCSPTPSCWHSWDGFPRVQIFAWAFLVAALKHSAERGTLSLHVFLG